MNQCKLILNSMIMIILITTITLLNNKTTSEAITSGSGARIIEYNKSGTAKFHMGDLVGRPSKITVEATGSKTITNVTFTSSNPSCVSITKQSGYWEISRLQEGTSVIHMSCKANEGEVHRDLLISAFSQLPKGEMPKATLLEGSEVYLGCSTIEGITSDDTEIKDTIEEEMPVTIKYQCNEFYRVERSDGYFGEKGENFGYVLKTDVEVPITGITVSPTITVKEKDKVTLGALPVPAITTESDLSYRSSNLAVIMVNQEGSIEATGPGTATVTITSISNPSISASCKIKVLPLYPVTGIRISPHDLEIEDGTVGKFNVFFEPANASIKDFRMESKNSGVLYVDNAGRYQALHPGETTVTVTSEDGGYTDTCKVTVKEVKAMGVYLQSQLEVGVGGKKRLHWNLLPVTASNKSVTWTSDNPDIASVDKYGIVTGVKTGDTTIRLVTEDGGFKAFCKVEVDTYVEDIVFTEYDNEMKTGTKQKIKVEITPEKPGKKNLIWNSKTPNILTVSQEGIVTAKKKGLGEILLYDRYTGAFDFALISVEGNLKKPQLEGKKKGKKLTLKWKKISKATNYVVYQYNSKKKKYTKEKTLGKNSTSYLIPNIKNGEKYKIRAYNKNTNEYSSFSKAVKVKK